MESLNDYNERRRILKLESQPNNIACPECGNELWDTDPSIVLPSDPPQIWVHCKHCSYKGLRVA
jgi:DNA-directed RNA polymerase subunit RPC12/RpoP